MNESQADAVGEEWMVHDLPQDFASIRQALKVCSFALLVFPFVQFPTAVIHP